MKKYWIFYLAIIMVLFVGCSNNAAEDPAVSTQPAKAEETQGIEEAATIAEETRSETVRIGITAQYLDIFEYALEEFERLSEKTLEIIVFDDYVQPNVALVEGSIDVNAFQFKNYLDTYNEERGTDIKMYGDKGIYATPYGIYSDKYTTLDDIENAKIAISNDKTNRGLCLRLLDEQKLITVGGDDPLPDPFDITDNPYNLELIEIGNTRDVFASLKDVDYGVTTGIIVHLAGEDATKAIAVGSSDLLQETALIIAVTEERLEEPWLEDLFESLTNERMKTYLKENYDGALVVE
ncbi:MAG: MetQ/NlpA family ABC transporter substrate-binding protein [Tissierellia bacterium]|nr:MetQ/NlpA family ABC transporter substrate-binding protein [Tissierellia bacterium]